MRIDGDFRVDVACAWRRWSWCAPGRLARTAVDPWSIPYWQHQERENERSGGIQAVAGGRCEPCFKPTPAREASSGTDAPKPRSSENSGTGYGLPKLGEVPPPNATPTAPHLREEVTRRTIGPIGRLIDVVA